MIGLTSQRDACSRAVAERLRYLRTLPEASGASSSARPAHHLVLCVPDILTAHRGATDSCPATARILITPHQIRRGD